MLFRRISKPPPRSDAELVEDFRRKGDISVLGGLYDRHMDTVYAVCLKYLKDRDLAQDAVMQVFEVVVKDLPRFEVQNFGGWLYGVTRNYCLMQLRSQKKGREISLIENTSADDVENGPLAHLTQEEEQESQETLLQQMEEGLQYLPEKQKTCLELFYLQELSYKQISEKTNWDLKDIKSQIQNGKRNLKIYLEKQRE
jgi:RNA polymerase sigma factor (sigma-70 family)